MVAAGVTISHAILSIGKHIAELLGLYEPPERSITKRIDALAKALGVEDKYREAILRKLEVL